MSSPRVLLVEDSRSAAQVIMEILSPQGFEITHAEDGQAAWEILATDNIRFDTVILDREMPRMNGIELLRKIKTKASLCPIPVVMVTTLSDEKSVREGLVEGAYYYLAKPFAAEVLLSVVRAALAQYQEYNDLRDSVRQAERPLELMENGIFRFRTIDDGRMLGKALARACPEPERTVLGLTELILNAIEHGNLGISYEEKSKLIMQDAWLVEINRRLDSPEGQDKHVTVRFRRTPKMVQISIQDQGKGFDWQKYLEFDASRAFDNHGRGIAMARMLSLDAVQYSGNGNMVTARINNHIQE